jgi:hypothetical protein
MPKKKICSFDCREFTYEGEDPLKKPEDSVTPGLRDLPFTSSYCTTRRLCFLSVMAGQFACIENDLVPNAPRSIFAHYTFK